MDNKILDVEKFISETGAKEVTNSKMFEYVNGEPVPTEDGLFSYSIFGHKYSKDRMKKWGWVNMGTEVVHPDALLVFDKISSAFRNIAERKRKYSIKNGVLEIDKDNGQWGIQYLKEVLKKIDWNKIPNYDDKKIYITRAMKFDPKVIFINKWHIMPAGFRDFNVKDGRAIYDEINDLYNDIIYASRNKISQDGLKYLAGKSKESSSDVSKEAVMQVLLNKLHDYILNRLSGKGGLIKGALIKKRTDFVARLVASSSPYIPPLGAAVPWHALINLFMPYVVNKIENNPEYKKLLFGDEEHITLDEYSSLFQYIFKNASTVAEKNSEQKKILIKILEEVLNENPLKITMKRDPAFGDTSWWGFYPIIDTGDNYNIKLNSLYYSPIGGDSVNFKTIWKMKHKSFVSNNKLVLRFPKGVYQFMDFDKYYAKKYKKDER